MNVLWLPVWLAVLGAASMASKRAAAPRVVVSRHNEPEGQARNDTITLTRPVDCADYLLAGATTSGVYEIYPFTCTCGSSVTVWCDMETDGGGWTVFLNRQEQTQQLDFNRTWNEYKAGFGTPGEEYWLGNDLLHKMTYSREYAVRLDFQDTTGGNDYATFERFRIDDEDNRYQATLVGSRTSGSFTSSCFSVWNTRYFTTRDRDYDSITGNCAANQGGGWWYYNCRYLNPTSTYNSSISLTCSSSARSVESLQMKIRPYICDSTVKAIHLQDNACGCAAQRTA